MRLTPHAPLADASDRPSNPEPARTSPIVVSAEELHAELVEQLRTLPRDQIVHVGGAK